MKRLLAGLALALLIASPVSGAGWKYDFCPNIPGMQSQVPDSYVRLLTIDGAYVCVPG